MARTPTRHLLSFRRAEGGVAAVEMALAAPLLIVVFAGLVELSFFISAQHRTSQMAATVADAISRYELIEGSDIREILSVASLIVDPDDFAHRGHVIVSSVQRGEGEADSTIAWQCTGGGSLAVESAVGAPNEQAALPGRLELLDKDNVIVAEAFYEYRPMFSGAGVPVSVLARTSVFRPRLGALTSDPAC